ncbi:MAG: putative Ig domain-containing protein [Turneriella sp.]
MQTQKIKQIRAAMAAAIVAFAVNACVQNEDAAAAAAVTAPSGLSYGAKTITLAQNVAVSKSASVTGSVASCSVAPALPPGLALDSTTCSISGTPTTTQAATSYTVTAANSAGSTTASVKIAVVQYTATMQGTPTHSVGKTTFQIKVTDSTGNGVAGLNPKIVPEMDMGSMVHTTPVDTVTDNGSGLYTAVVYYLMSSDGGTWYIKTLNSGGMTEIGTRIAMIVGGSSTARVSVSNSADQYSNMMTATNRPYFVFVDAVSGGAGNHTVSIFAATRKSMMDHPALANGLVLTPATGSDWTVNGATTSIRLSIDGGTSWVGTLSDNGTGHFSLGSIAGLTAGSKTLTFEVTVNGTVRGTGSLTAVIP